MHLCQNQINKQAGFSVVKFLVICGVLGLIFNYVLRPKMQQWEAATKIANATEAANEVTAAVADHYYTHLKLPRSNEDLNLPPPKHYETDRVESVTVSRGGVITIRLNELGKHIMQGDDYTMTPYLNEYEKIVWRCEPGTLHVRYLPIRCG